MNVDMGCMSVPCFFVVVRMYHCTAHNIVLLGTRKASYYYEKCITSGRWRTKHAILHSDLLDDERGTFDSSGP